MKPRSVMQIVVAALLVSCGQAGGASEEVKIRQYSVGGIRLFVPDAYLNTKGSSIGRDAAFIQTFYPGSMPITEDPMELWRKGEWYKNINIVFQQADPSRAPHVLNGQINLTKSFKSAGSRHGLQHFTQESESDSFKNDIWIDDKESGSFISCDDAQDAPANPQCTQYLFSETLFVQITYSKEFLPKWGLIKSNVLDMINSFQARDTAIEYVNKVMGKENFAEDGQ